MSLLATATDDLWTAWSLDPVVLAAATVALAFFLQGWRRLRSRRPELAPWTRIPLFLAGVAVVLVGLLSPLDAIAEEYLQSAHMLQHVLIADLGVALALVAVRGPLSMFFLPRDLLAPLARVGGLRSALSFVLRPAVALPLWLAVLLAWHVPPLYEAALTQPLVHRLEHLSFVVVGVLVWTLLVDPAGHGRMSVSGRIGLAVVLFWAGQLLAYVFVFGFEPYYDVYVEQPERLFGLSPLTDQKLAGVAMMAEQALTLGVALALLVRTARRSRPTRSATPEPAGELVAK
jgi:cytochrome c oxidase assembly factor CtaG